MSKRYPRVLPNDLSKFRRQPGDERLPILDLTPVKKNELNFFPDGIYVQVSSISDVFAAQGFHPVRLILELTSETKKDLTEGITVLPFSKKSMFISLDPFCPQEIVAELEDSLNKLIEKGYKVAICEQTEDPAAAISLRAVLVEGISSATVTV